VAHALAAADREGVDWVLLVRGSTIRLHSAKPDVGVGRRGRSATYLEANLDLLPHDEAGYLPLIFSAQALAAGSTAEILEASNLFVTDLGGRLRDRVYFDAVPTLAEAIARQSADLDPEGLRSAYGRTMTVLFRLLFVAYAEDKELLPYRTDGAYADRSLTTIARELTDRRLDGDTEHEDFDGSSTELWRRVSELWTAIDRGEPSWHVPAYGGTLFSSDPKVNPDGAALADIVLSDAEFGPTLSALLVDRSSDGLVGPVDFRSLSVREFGTIYEGLLESELSVAQQDLTETKKGLVPASGGDEITVAEGEVYFHNRSGARKSTGSYFTKPFAVEHLLRHALAPAIDDHLERVGALVEAGDEAAAATALFDFRIADIAMGSGHFLVAAVDHLEARFSRFLTEHPIPPVGRELAALQTAAEDLLGDLAERYRIDTTQVLRRLIARRCVYGCDLNPVSVELARLAIWIHTFVPGLPLSFLDHNLVVGNSLTGVGTLDEVSDFVEGGLAKAHIDAQIEAAKPHLARIAALSDARIEDVEAAREAADAAREALQPARRLLDMLVLARAGLADMDPMLLTDEDMVARRHAMPDAQGYVEALEPLHFPITFPEVFLRDRPGFDCILGNPPWEKLMVKEDEFWLRYVPGLMGAGQSDKQLLMRNAAAVYPEESRELVSLKSHSTLLRTLLAHGPFPGAARGHFDLYKLFSWRFWQLVGQAGHIGVVLPWNALADAALEEWRRQVFISGSYDDITELRNTKCWLFDIGSQIVVALMSITKGSCKPVVQHQGPFSSLSQYRARNSKLTIERDTYRTWSSNSSFLSFPPDQRSVTLFSKIREHPRFSDPEQPWRAGLLYNELSLSQDSEMLLSDAGPDRIPVFSGKSIDLFAPGTNSVYGWLDLNEANSHFSKKRLNQARLSSSIYFGLSEDILNNLDTLSFHRCRVALRKIARRGDARTIIAALLPPFVVAQDGLPVLVVRKGGIRAEMFILGMLATATLDWQARRFVELNVLKRVIDNLAIPVDDSGDRANRVVHIATVLSVVDARFSSWAAKAGVPIEPSTPNQRADLMAELDAVVAHLYGLDRSDLEAIWDTFYDRVRRNDRRPDLVKVLEHHERWADTS
jgi:hypothetical protein